MNKLSLILVGGGAIALALSLVLGWLGFPHVMRSQIKQSSRLIEGSQTYSIWKGPAPFPVYLKFYFFNVTNPDEVQAGEKPIVTEMGPYTYLQKKMKIDIEPGVRNDSLQYRNQLWLHFNREMSSGSEDDVLTFINIPLLGVIKMATTLTSDEAVHKAIHDKLIAGGEGLFRRTSIRNFMFEGFSIEPYLELFKDPALASLGEFRIPEAFQTGTYAIYQGRNGSDDGLFEVNTGVKDYKEFGQILAWNNETALPWWNHDACNNLNGTDGTVFSPFVTRDTILQTFSPELCRRLTLIYEQDTAVKNIPGLRFQADPKMFMGPHHNPSNLCFCAERNPKDCEKDGLILLSGCTEGSPVSLSGAHFFGAPASLVDAVEGIRPEMDKHKTFMDIEPNTATMLKVAKRLQMNIELTQRDSMSTFEKVHNITFPIMWTEEFAELPDALLKKFNQFYKVQGWVDQGKWIMVGVSVGCLFLGVLVDASITY